MKKLTLLSGFILLGAVAAVAQSTWDFDKAHSSITFSVDHLVISEVVGNFGTFEGTLESPNDNFEGSTVNFTLEVNSINTDNEKRDGHLKSDDFFNAKKYPNITFTGKSLKHVDGKMYKLEGELTIRDVTKSVVLDAKHGGTITDNRGNIKAGFKITGVINRFDYNLKYNPALEAGGLVVGEEVEIICNIELMKQS